MQYTVLAVVVLIFGFGNVECYYGIFSTIGTVFLAKNTQ